MKGNETFLVISKQCGTAVYWQRQLSYQLVAQPLLRVLFPNGLG